MKARYVESDTVFAGYAVETRADQDRLLKALVEPELLVLVVALTFVIMKGGEVKLMHFRRLPRSFARLSAQTTLQWRNPPVVQGRGSVRKGVA
jgi:hypothetical protein